MCGTELYTYNTLWYAYYLASNKARRGAQSLERVHILRLRVKYSYTRNRFRLSVYVLLIHIRHTELVNTEIGSELS